MKGKGPGGGGPPEWKGPVSQEDPKLLVYCILVVIRTEYVGLSKRHIIYVNEN